MTKIVFASNNITHWPLANPGFEVGTYDADRVPYSIKLSNLETLNSPKFTPVTGEDTWFHFRFHAIGVGSAILPLIRAYNDDGSVLFDIVRKSSSQMLCTAILDNGTTSVQADATTAWAFSKVNTCDVHVTTKALGVELRLYVNSALAAELIMTSNPNGLTAPSSFSLGSCMNYGTSSFTSISEIIVADGDTRNARLDLLRPSATGAYEQWSGLLTTLADDDPTTGMTTIAAAQRQTVSLTPYTGAANMSNFVITSQTTRGQNSPTGLQHTIRLSGVDYDSTAMPLDFQLQYNMTDYEINPATSLPWLGSDLALIETGFISVA